LRAPRVSCSILVTLTHTSVVVNVYSNEYNINIFSLVT
jgi:hypothetical protein